MIEELMLEKNGKKIRLIKQQKSNKSTLARKLGISRSLIYYQYKRPIIDEEIKSMIQEVLKFQPVYGHKLIFI